MASILTDICTLRILLSYVSFIAKSKPLCFLFWNSSGSFAAFSNTHLGYLAFSETKKSTNADNNE